MYDLKNAKDSYDKQGSQYVKQSPRNDTAKYKPYTQGK